VTWFSISTWKAIFFFLKRSKWNKSYCRINDL
jgi:hypothetical protein